MVQNSAQLYEHLVKTPIVTVSTTPSNGVHVGFTPLDESYEEPVSPKDIT